MYRVHKMLAGYMVVSFEIGYKSRSTLIKTKPLYKDIFDVQQYTKELKHQGDKDNTTFTQVYDDNQSHLRGHL